MLDTNVDYLSQTLHGALRTSDHADSTAVVRDAFQRLQQLQTQVRMRRGELEARGHFASPKKQYKSIHFSHYSIPSTR